MPTDEPPAPGVGSAPASFESTRAIVQAMAALREGDLEGAYFRLEARAEATDATPDEQALFALLSLLSFDESCERAHLTARWLGAEIDAATDFFGPSGFFRRRNSMSIAEAFRELEDKYRTDDYPNNFDSLDKVSELVAETRAWVDCVDTLTDRLAPAFTAGRRPFVTIPKELFQINVDIQLDPADFRALQAMLEASAAVVMLVNTYAWDFPRLDRLPVFVPGLEAATAERQWLNTIAQLNDGFLRPLATPPEGYSQGEARELLDKALAHAMDAITLARDLELDSGNTFHAASVDAVAYDLAYEFVASVRDALFGPTAVPRSEPGLTWDFSPLFDGSWLVPDADPFWLRVRRDDYGTPSDPSDDRVLFQPELEPSYVAQAVNQLFSLPIVDDPGPFGDFAEARPFEDYTEDQIDFLERSQSYVRTAELIVRKNFCY